MTTNISSLHVQNILSTLVIHVSSAHKFGLNSFHKIEYKKYK